MNTSLKVILTAIGIAVLASPVMAESSHSERSTAGISHARGSVSHIRREWREPAVEGSQIRVNDCIHMTFPSCGDDASRAEER